MNRLKISICFGNKPNFNKEAFKYFILYLNKIQATYEFYFPDVETYPFADEVCQFNGSSRILLDFVARNKIVADYHLAIITQPFDTNYFFNSDNETAIITTDKWDKYFSPPSLFEYLLHCFISCLIYSQKAPIGRTMTEEMKSIVIDKHNETRGCTLDFTRDKVEDKVDILLGYICDEHQTQIKNYYGEGYYKEMKFIAERTWIGTKTEINSVSYNLKHGFRLDIDKESGFNKSWWDKCREKIIEIPGNLIWEVLKVAITVLITYILLKIGIQSK